MYIPDEWSSIPGNGEDRTRLTGQLMLYFAHAVALRASLRRGDALAPGRLRPVLALLVRYGFSGSFETAVDERQRGLSATALRR